MKAVTTILMLNVGSLLALGMVMLYSSAAAKDGTHLLMMQSIWCGAGLITAFFLARIDYRIFKKYAWVLLVISIILLILVIIPSIGVRRGGSRRWFNLGFALFQPSELAKLCLIIALAAYIDRFQRHMSSFFKGLILPSLIIGIVLGLIFVEPDRGTTALLAAVCGVMLLVAGVKLKHLIPIGALGVALFVFSLLNDPMRGGRIYSWLHQEETRTEKGYQGWQSMLAFGSGGTTGLGLGNGRQKLGFVPEGHTDFILSVIGEELGLVATAGTVIGFLVLMGCGVFIAMRARDTFGYMLAVGITFLTSLQAFINIGVVTGALPNKGLALPFISYGGSSLLMTLSCMGILFSIALRSTENGDESTTENSSKTISTLTSRELSA